MRTVFHEKKVTGILAVLPERESYFDDEVDNYHFSQKQTMQLKKVMGLNKHRLSKKDSTATDFCIYGLNYLLGEKKLRKEEIGAVVVVSMCPDYFLPHNSNVIQGECGLPEDVLCMDIAQGCNGYLMGLMQSFLLLDHMPEKKVVLFNADVLSHKISEHDRHSYPLMGDVTCISIIEQSESARDIYFQVYNDGTKRNAVIIPAGGFAMPSSEKTAAMIKQEDGNERCLDNYYMDGTEVFNFAQLRVPPLVESILVQAGLEKEDIDYFLLHQPNKFMLTKLANKLKLPYEKVFMNIVENYGNPSGASIPLTVVHNMKDMMCKELYTCCLVGFGSGLSWGGAVMELGRMDFCEKIQSAL